MILISLFLASGLGFILGVSFCAKLEKRDWVGYLPPAIIMLSLVIISL